MIVLAIESSCDECSAAVLRDDHLLSICTRTQTVHQPYGGVVPELAGRSHLELIDVMVERALTEAKVTLSEVNLLAATSGPGLVGSLLVGLSYSRGLAAATGIPLRAVHHVEAHLFSAEIGAARLPFPFLVLLASGGHTLLVLANGLRRYEVIGSTLDDAMGEAYDKVGKLVGLSFPAGADVDRIAQSGNPTRFSFPVVMQDQSFNVSYSGLKTAVARVWRRVGASAAPTDIADLLASFQASAVESVVRKLSRAVEHFHPQAVVAAGGVAANSVLRRRLSKLASERGIQCLVPNIEFCGDNAAMIGYLAWKLAAEGIAPDDSVTVRPRWPLEELSGVSRAA